MIDALLRTLRWQWANYPSNHRDPVNLALHAVGVPLALAALPLAIGAAIQGEWLPAALSLLLLPLGIGLQAVGHKREAVKAVPFAGPADMLVRLALEQAVTFPRFVATRLFG